MSYKVENFGELLRRGSQEDIERIYSSIDALWSLYPSLPGPGNDMGSDEKWHQIMEKAADYMTVIKFEEDLVGYWFVTPVSERIYERGISGENINKELLPEDVPLLVRSGAYKFYFVDYILHPRHRSPKVQSLSYQSMQDFLDSLCESNFMISKIFAHASSEDSRSLCENFGFKWKAKHKFHTKKYRDEEIPTDIYELDIALSFENIIDQTRKKLLKNYAKYYQSNWLIRLIYSGESDVLEFKRFDGGFEGINRAICAMSNAGGGTVLIGIEDNRSVMGVNLEKYRGDSDRFSQALTSSMLSNIQGLSPRDVTVKCHWIDRKCVFAVEVRDAKSSISGVGFTRVGTTTRRLD